MRPLIAIASLAGALIVSAAQAETRTFIIANNPDGYGVDRCLATGDECGDDVATAYCRSQEFAEARAFHKVAAGEITGAASAHGAQACRTGCDEFVAIECTR